MSEETTKVSLMHKIGLFMAERMHAIEYRIREVENKQSTIPDHANVGTMDDLLVAYYNHLDPDVVGYYGDTNTYNDDGTITPVDAHVV